MSEGTNDAINPMWKPTEVTLSFGFDGDTSLSVLTTIYRGDNNGPSANDLALIENAVLELEKTEDGREIMMFQIFSPDKDDTEEDPGDYADVRYIKISSTPEFMNKFISQCMKSNKFIWLVSSDTFLYKAVVEYESTLIKSIKIEMRLIQ